MNTKKRFFGTIATNKKAFFSYEVIEQYVAGVVLNGPEVKSIRLGKVNLKDAYCFFRNNELWLQGMHISHYAPAAQYAQEPNRLRKLLLQKQELRKLQKKKEKKSFTIVALRLFINEKSKMKIVLALARGKKMYDKRAVIKERDLLRKSQAEERN